MRSRPIARRAPTMIVKIRPILQTNSPDGAELEAAGSAQERTTPMNGEKLRASLAAALTEGPAVVPGQPGAAATAQPVAGVKTSTRRRDRSIW